MTAPTEAEIRARIAEHDAWERGHPGHWHVLVFDDREGRFLLRLVDEARAERNAARADAEANRADAERWRRLYDAQRARLGL